KSAKQSGNKQVTSNASASKQSASKQQANKQTSLGKAADKNSINRKAADKNSVDKSTVDQKSAVMNTIDQSTVDQKSAVEDTIDQNTVGQNKIDKNSSVKNTVNPGAGKPVANNTDMKAHIEIKPQVGGLAYTGKIENEKVSLQAVGLDGKKPQLEAQTVKHEEHHNTIGRNMGMAPVTFKPNIKVKEDEEDDEILKALDKFFDDTKKER
ncbi:MAG: hypothetical protein K0R46_807, partial [Herbinix sp.]|nr:hypothetical protein [Herbinix sp.]